MKQWKVKSKGKLEKMVIFYFFLSIAILGILLHGARRTRVSLWETNSEDVLFFLLTTFPIWIPLIIVTLKRLLSSKIPKVIELDEEKGILQIVYSRKRQDIIDVSSLAYSHSEMTGSHGSLTFYRTFLGTRGQQVYNEVVQIVAVKWTFSWKLKQLQDIIHQLEVLNVERRTSINESVSLVDKIIS